VSPDHVVHWGIAIRPLVFGLACGEEFDGSQSYTPHRADVTCTGCRLFIAAESL